MAQQSLIQSRAEAADSRQTALFPLLHTHHPEADEVLMGCERDFLSLSL